MVVATFQHSSPVQFEAGLYILYIQYMYMYKCFTVNLVILLFLFCVCCEDLTRVFLLSIF